MNHKMVFQKLNCFENIAGKMCIPLRVIESIVRATEIDYISLFFLLKDLLSVKC